MRAVSPTVPSTVVRSLTRRLLLAGIAGAALPRLAGAANDGVHPRPLRFPADFGSHPDTRTEWWYVTGELQAGDAVFGFQVTFFRSATGIVGDHPSRFTARQIVFAHAAVSDVAGKHLRHDQRIAREGFGVAQARQGGTDVRLRDWHMARSGTVEASRYEVAARSEAGGFALALSLDASRIVLQGNAGYSVKGRKAGEASHYYSRPQMAVSGTLTLDGKERPVTGRAWLDHEWSDAYMDSEATGWDWIGINLDKGESLMAFRMRRADGTTLYAGGSWTDAQGHTRNFAPDEVRFTPGRVWTSPRSRGKYPVAWNLDIPNGRYTIKALIDDQEMDSRGSTGAYYWEGLSELADAKGQRVGRGYLEMTGYADPIRL
jgi:predicted secreted hydrolase